MKLSILIGLLVVIQVVSPLLRAAPDVKRLKADREKLSAQIEKLNSSNLTCRIDTDCTSLEMGRKPCGGAWKFLIASTKNPNLGEVKKKLAAYAKLDESYNKAAELMSDCSMAAAPEVACIEKKCRAKETAAEDLKPQ